MDSQNTSFSQPPSSIDPDEARRRFLASMGIGDLEPETSREIASATQKSGKNEDGVALSSSPDDLELPGAPLSSQARSRVISYDVRPKSTVKASQPEAGQSLRVEEKIKENAANETSSEAVDKTSAKEPESMTESNADTKGPLQLSCPKCKGDLVLMHEHIGIEGACVWCDTKIVAARSGTDGEVRVFPLFQPDSLKPAADPAPESPSGSIATEPVSELSQEIDDMVSKAHVDPAPAVPESVEKEVDSVSEKETPPAQAVPEFEAASTDWSGGFDTPAISPLPESNEAPAPTDGFGDSLPVQESIPAEKVESAETFPSGFADSSSHTSSDSAAPSAANDSVADLPSGFGEPGSSPATASPADGASDLDEAPVSAGFSDGFSADPFQSAMPALEEATEKVDGAEAPAEFSEGWGEAPSPAAEAAGFSESPFSEDAAIEFEAHSSPELTNGSSEAEAPAGFSDAASWGPPAGSESNDLEPAPEERDDAPKSLEEPAAFQSGFEAVSAKGDDPVAEVEGPLWGSADEVPPQEAPTEDRPSAPIGESSSDFGSGFAIPNSEGSSFASETSSSSDDEDSIFSDAAGTDESANDEIATWGNQSEEASVSAEPLVESDAKAAEPDAPFEAAAKPQLFSASSSNDTGGSIFGNQSSATTGPPPIPGAAAPAERPGNGLFGGSPTVTSQPLGSKPAKKKGKGLVVFMVILLGLVCGAALASFVLPVDEYVGKARAFMEQKLNMESGVDPALFLSELVAPDNGEAPPAFTSALEDATDSVAPQLPESVPTPKPAPAAAPAATAPPQSAPVQAPVAP